MKVLGLDPGYAHFGWAYLDFTGQHRLLIDAGEWTLDVNDGTESERVVEMSLSFGRRLALWEADVIGIEAFIPHGERFNPAVARYMNELVGRIKQRCETVRVPCYEIPTTACKAALGLRGKVSKERVRRAVEMYFGTRVGEHLADAVAVGVAARARHSATTMQVVASASRVVAVEMRASARAVRAKKSAVPRVGARDTAGPTSKLRVPRGTDAE